MTRTRTCEHPTCTNTIDPARPFHTRHCSEKCERTNPNKRPSLAERMERFKRYALTNEWGCWLHTEDETVIKTIGVKVGDEHKNLTLHRAAYEVWVGPIGENDQVRHRCGARACYNPRHLRLLKRP